MTNASFLGYIHVFRCFAIGMVVLSHLILSLQWQNQEALHLARMLFSNGTVYFIFIAGYLFQYLLPKYSYGSYLKKKLQYVLLPYFITSIPIILAKLAGKIPDYPAFSEHFGQLSALQKVLVYYLTGMHLGPLWFIPMICLFYLAAPLFILATKWQKAYLLFPLLILVNLGIPRPWVHDPLISGLHFAPIYLIGMLACRYRERIFQYSQKLWPVLLGLLILLCLLEFTNRPFMAFNSVTKVIASFLIIYGLQRHEKYGGQIFSPWIDSIANYSFGIFFLHQYAIGLYSRAITPLGHLLKDANILTVAIGFLAVNGACLLLLLGIKRVLVDRSRYIVGC
jgi:probable poly-beta-1,6-N-acetyl-D-glucosamine export protein